MISKQHGRRLRNNKGGAGTGKASGSRDDREKEENVGGGNSEGPPVGAPTGPKITGARAPANAPKGPSNPGRNSSASPRPSSVLFDGKDVRAFTPMEMQSVIAYKHTQIGNLKKHGAVENDRGLVTHQTVLAALKYYYFNFCRVNVEVPDISAEALEKSIAYLEVKHAAVKLGLGKGSSEQWLHARGQPIWELKLLRFWKEKDGDGYGSATSKSTTSKRTVPKETTWDLSEYDRSILACLQKQVEDWSAEELRMVLEVERMRRAGLRFNEALNQKHIAASTLISTRLQTIYANMFGDSVQEDVKSLQEQEDRLQHVQEALSTLHDEKKKISSSKRTKNPIANADTTLLRIESHRTLLEGYWMELNDSIESASSQSKDKGKGNEGRRASTGLG